MSYQDVKRQLEESERIRRELEASLEGTLFMLSLKYCVHADSEVVCS